MLVFCGFRLEGIPRKEGEDFFQHPALGVGDVMRLEELFPGDAALGRVRENNQATINSADARALHDKMKKYEGENVVSDEKYIAGGMSSPFPMSNDLRSAFDSLLPFLAEVGGVAPNGSAAEIYAERRRQEFTR